MFKHEFTVIKLLIIVAIIVMMFDTFKYKLRPVPYYNVEKLEVNWNSYYVDFHYNFFKEDFDLVAFSASGVSAGVPKGLDYFDLDGLEKNFNRPVGLQSLNVRVLTEGVYYEEITLHTRHLCEGEYINTEFDTAVNPNEKE